MRAPEADVVQRITEAFGPPQWVPRLTNVKFPASKRRDVYRTRPCHEQAYWLTRIREAEDAEAMVRAHRASPISMRRNGLAFSDASNMAG